MKKSELTTKIKPFSVDLASNDAHRLSNPLFLENNCWEEFAWIRISFINIKSQATAVDLLL